MKTKISRREMMRASVATMALMMMERPLRVLGFEDPGSGDTLIPFLDSQPVDPNRAMCKWEDLTTWLTPTKQVFNVSHYGTPTVDTTNWKLDISGLVKKPRALTLSDIRSRKRQDVIATLECSGNGADVSFCGAIGNVRWTGTPLAPILKECGIEKRATEVVFYGADEKAETIRGKSYVQNFARALSPADTLRDDVILAYEMNGEPLTKEHGAPVRLIVPGWFGITWVKWLTRIELLDRRFASKFMARDYVTLRGEERDGKTIWRETVVGQIDVKSITARVVRRKDGSLRVSGAAWTDGTPLKSVELKIDDGAWQAVELDKKQRAKYAWTFWSFDWKNPPAGEHTIVSRATDTEGRVQPAPDDPSIKLKRTYYESNQQWTRKIKI